jgi:hypothetical protein
MRKPFTPEKIGECFWRRRLSGTRMRKTILVSAAGAAFLAMAVASLADARPLGGKWTHGRSWGGGPARFAVPHYGRYRYGYGVVAVGTLGGGYLADDAWFLADSAGYLADPAPSYGPLSRCFGCYGPPWR